MSNEVKSGTLVGLMVSIIHLIPWDKLLETIFITIVGTTASFIVGRLWGYLFKK